MRAVYVPDTGYPLNEFHIVYDVLYSIAHGGVQRRFDIVAGGDLNTPHCVGPRGQFMNGLM